MKNKTLAVLGSIIVLALSGCSTPQTNDFSEVLANSYSKMNYQYETKVIISSPEVNLTYQELMIADNQLATSDETLVLNDNYIPMNEEIFKELSSDAVGLPYAIIRDLALLYASEDSDIKLIHEMPVAGGGYNFQVSMGDDGEIINLFVDEGIILKMEFSSGITKYTFDFSYKQ